MTSPTISQSRENTMALARHSYSQSSVSLLSSNHATAVDVCSTMYGETHASPDAVERLYESSASESLNFGVLFYDSSLAISVSSLLLLNRHRSNPQRYENPVLTATSRSVITDIHQLSRHLSVIDVPRPIALLCTLFRLQPPRTGFLARHLDEPLFEALRVWTEIGDISETESFDGHRKTIVEHTLNVLILPGIHRDGQHRIQAPSESLILTPGPSSHSLPTSHPAAPGLGIPGTSLTIPSPLHFQLHIITRLSFNEQGRITHHRDFWDIKDVMGLVPGVSLAQWIGTRLAARGLTYAASFLYRPLGIGAPDETASAKQPLSEQDAMELGMVTDTNVK
ncbi:unnamed protein product [Mycena citricolor]|uniref:Uncharacterized protein n=1 Tax=Mycena citricolor TaxID=2018698 RepID=A0AAD2GTW5_9AGAR|nr:unnamed protein product [Mycena citricolor]